MKEAFEPVDLDVMLAEPVPFAKWKGKTYSIKPLPIKDLRKYMKVLMLGPAITNLSDTKAEKSLKECFENFVVDEEGKKVSFEMTEEWPSKALEMFVRKLLGISG